jgi:hypothetical protein
MTDEGIPPGSSLPKRGAAGTGKTLLGVEFIYRGIIEHDEITVVKARGSEHQFVTREFAIGQGGMSLLPMEEGKGLPVLPFQSYYGLLSRAPTRLSPDLPRGGVGGALPGAT